MDKNSRVARLLEIEREKQKALFALSGDIIFDYDLEKDLIIFSDEYKNILAVNVSLQTQKRPFTAVCLFYRRICSSWRS